jgi:hypothetical protein
MRPLNWIVMLDGTTLGLLSMSPPHVAMLNVCRDA